MSTNAPSTHTRATLMVEVLAAASGLPIDQIEDIVAILKPSRGFPGDGPLTETEYQILKAQLTKELPGILSWMVRGAIEAGADPSVTQKLRLQGVRRT